jgi:TrmH family RNA methyltransferase
LALSSADIKFIRSLQQKKNRKESGLFVVEGVKVVSELLRSDLSVQHIYATEDVDLGRDTSEMNFTLISEKDLSRISSLKTPNRVLATVKLPEDRPINFNPELILALDGIRDPGNLGTILRTARWFGLDQIICSEDCADAFSPKVVQSTMGALFHMNIRYCNLSEFASEAVSKGCKLVSTAMNGTRLDTAKSLGKQVVFVGSESHGVSEQILELCHERITIANLESERKVESLNAAVATSLVLYEFTRHA